MIVSDPPLNVRLRDEQIQALSSKIKTRDFTPLILTCLEPLEPYNRNLRCTSILLA